MLKEAKDMAKRVRESSTVHAQIFQNKVADEIYKGFATQVAELTDETTLTAAHFEEPHFVAASPGF